MSTNDDEWVLLSIPAYHNIPNDLQATPLDIVHPDTSNSQVAPLNGVLVTPSGFQVAPLNVSGSQVAPLNVELDTLSGSQVASLNVELDTPSGSEVAPLNVELDTPSGSQVARPNVVLDTPSGSQVAPLNVVLDSANGPFWAGNEFKLEPKNCQNSEVAAIVYKVINNVYNGVKPRNEEEEERTTGTPADQVLSEMVQLLKKHYSIRMQEDKLSPEERFVDFDMVKLSRTNRSVKQAPIQLEEILSKDPELKTEQFCVLIHGEPGGGKTSLCKKIMYDWAKTKDSALSSYSLVLYVPFRALNTNIDDYIVNICCNSIRQELLDPNLVKTILKTLGSRFLLVLDGLEELHEDVQDSFYNLLTLDLSRQQSLLNLATLIVTTRLNPQPQVAELFDCHVMLKGFSVLRQVEYINKYFDHDLQKQTAMARIIENGTFNRFSKCPLTLYCLCYVYDMENFIDFSDVTDLYKTMINSMFKRSLHVSRELDLEKLSLSFGNLCWEYLNKSNLYVTRDDIQAQFFTQPEQNVIKHSGLLVSPTYMENITRDSFEPCHRIIFEYSAAMYLKSIFKAHGKLSSAFVQKYACILTGEKTQVMPFLRCIDEGKCEIDDFIQEEIQKALTAKTEKYNPWQAVATTVWNVLTAPHPLVSLYLCYRKGAETKYTWPEIMKLYSENE